MKLFQLIVPAIIAISSGACKKSTEDSKSDPKILGFGSKTVSPLDSSALAGSYKLTKVGRMFGEDYAGCHKHLEIQVNHNGVFVNHGPGVNHGSGTVERFKPQDENKECVSAPSSIGAGRKWCTKFEKWTVEKSDTVPISVAGYLKEFTKLSLTGADRRTLIFKGGDIEIPIPLDGPDFNCTYAKL